MVRNLTHYSDILHEKLVIAHICIQIIYISHQIKCGIIRKNYSLCFSYILVNTNREKRYRVILQGTTCKSNFSNLICVRRKRVFFLLQPSCNVLDLKRIRDQNFKNNFVIMKHFLTKLFLARYTWSQEKHILKPLT